MLYGEFQHNIDQKGRVTVPSKFREDLGEKFYVCRGLDKCLFVYSESEWQKLVSKVAEMPVGQAKGIQRYLFAGAADVETDKQCRILLPQPLRDHAGLEKEVTVIGTGVRAEIWATDTWKQYNDNFDEDDIEAAMSALGI